MEPYHPQRDDPLVLSVDSAASRLPQQGYLQQGGSHSSQAARLGYGSDPHRHPSPVSLRKFLAVLFRRWRRIGLVMICVLAVTAAAVVYLPPHYRSEAKLLVRLGRESVAIDPTASIGGQSAVPMEGRDKEINSEIELLKSRQLVEAAVASIGANRILSLKPNQPETPANVASAITLVESKLAIEAVPESSILSIQFEARDPELARDLIAKLIDAYLDQRAAIYRGQGDQKFFEDQLATARDEQSKIEKQIQDLRDSSGVADPTAQRAALIKLSDDLQQEIDKDRADREAEAASVNAVTKARGSADADHQRVIQAARDSLLESMIHSLTNQKTEAEMSLKHVNEVDVQMQQLQQQATLSAARVKQYSEAYEQTRIDRAMGQQRLSNISIAEAPVLPLTAKAPSRGLLAMAGVFLAVTLGLGSGLVADAMDHTVRSADDLAALGIPHTVSIPVLTKAELKPRFKRWQLPRISPADDDGGGGGHEIIDGIEEDHPTNGTSPAFNQLADSLQPKGNGIRENGLSRTNGTAVANGHSTQITTRVAGVAIRPAGALAISPRMLDAVQGIIERMIPSLDNDAVPRLIGVIGPRPGQGVSTIAFHLAVSLSQMMDAKLQDPQATERVLLLDADVESCRSSEMAGLALFRQFEEALPSDLAGPIPLSSMTSPDGNHRLDVLTAGMRSTNKSLLSAQMPQLLRSISLRYRHVVIDFPSMANNESSARFAGLCSTVVLVCNADELRRETVQQAIARLRAVRANLNVAVLNRRRYPVPEWIYRRS
jgi:uncharacterized protein involved in exopolysaccharide biosynthesis/Mrp family chromosome partitioning ATPase